MREWYGLIADGELIAINSFHCQPTIFDFHVGYSSRCDYDVVIIEPVIKKILDPLE